MARMGIRFLSGASRRPSSDLSGQSLQRASSLSLLPLIRSLVMCIEDKESCV